MAFNFDQNDSSEDDRYKLHDNYSSEGMDSETETTLLGYVHYNSVTVSSKPQPIESPKQTPEITESESQDPLKEENTLTNLKEVSLTIQPTQPVIEAPREQFVATSTNFALRSRYFSEVSSVTCYNCSKQGHMSRDCPLNNCCSQCKDPYHTLSECPWTLCTICKQFGHSDKICTSNSFELSCSHCNSDKHDTKSCRVFWREYLDFKQPKVSERLPKWCYQCGEMNHFGDSCKFGFIAHTTSFCGTDAEDLIGKGKARINPLFHAYFTEPIISDIAPETASSVPENRNRFRQNDRHSNINHRLAFSSNSDHRFKANNYRNDGMGSRSDLFRRADNHYSPQDRYRNFNPRDSPTQYQQSQRNFRRAPSPRNGSKYGGHPDHRYGFK